MQCAAQAVRLLASGVRSCADRMLRALAPSQPTALPAQPRVVPQIQISIRLLEKLAGVKREAQPPQQRRQQQ